MFTCTYPGTITGIRWSFGVRATATTSIISWFIVITRDGYAANTPALTNGSSLYQPEGDVLAFGGCPLSFDADGSNPVIMFNDSTKTMRKLQNGDVMQFVTLGDQAASGTLHGALQFFLKT